MTSSNMYIAFTHTDVKKTQFTWKIDNFSILSTSLITGSKLDSPNFIIQPDDNIKWHLSAWPNGTDNSYSGFLSMSLNCSCANNCNVHGTILLSALDSKGQKCFENTQLVTFNSSSRTDFHTFISKNLLAFKNNGILLNDVLTICCQLTVVYKDSMKNNDETIQQRPVCVYKKLSSAFEKQLEKQEFSDVKLVVSCGKELRAHKFVLAARSPVFSAMFTNDMKEKNDDLVVIQDLDYDSLKEMLRFMYTARVENLDEVAGGVLAVQEKYQIEGLKELCEEYFFQNINVENAVDTLALSIRYNLDKINILAKKFIRCHAKDVTNSAAFKAIIDEPYLLAEIVNILADLS